MKKGFDLQFFTDRSGRNLPITILETRYEWCGSKTSSEFSSILHTYES